MPFHFSILCDLFNTLDRARMKRACKRGSTARTNAHIITTWFEEHQQLIPREGLSALAFLSCIFPERRPDRVFELQEKRLESIIQRAQCLGATRLQILQNWRTRDGVDFPSCVENVLLPTDAETRPGPKVSLEEINDALDRIAALSSFSSPELKAEVSARYAKPVSPVNILSWIFRRLDSSESKWMIRMILKSYSPMQIPEQLVLRQFHPILPKLLMIQNSLQAVCQLLKENIDFPTDLEAVKNIEGERQFQDTSLFHRSVSWSHGQISKRREVSSIVVG
jgi:DNA ligase-4